MTRIECECAMADMWCGACLSLGIPDPTIMEGDEFMVVRFYRNVPRFKLKIRFYCKDCFIAGHAFSDQALLDI